MIDDINCTTAIAMIRLVDLQSHCNLVGRLQEFLEDQRDVVHLMRSNFDRVPVHSRKYVDYELRVVGNVTLLKLSVLIVEGKAKRRRFARLHGACKERRRENLHLASSDVFLRMTRLAVKPTKPGFAQRFLECGVV